MASMASSARPPSPRPLDAERGDSASGRRGPAGAALVCATRSSSCAPCYQRSASRSGCSRHVSSGLNRLRVAAARHCRGRLVAAGKSRDRRAWRSLQLQDAFITMAANLRDARRRARRGRLSRSARRAKCCSRCSARWCARSGWPRSVCSSPASRTSSTTPCRRFSGRRRSWSATPGLPPEALRGNRAAQDAERPGARHHPQPVPLQQPAARTARARRSARRRRRGRFSCSGRDLEKAAYCARASRRRPPRRVFANMTELEQVTLNFVINAQQAIQAAGAARRADCSSACCDGGGQGASRGP